MSAGAAATSAKLLERGARELERAGVPESRWQAELLLRHALGCSRETLLARLDRPVGAEAAGVYFQLLEKRRSRVPVQYLTGTQEFWGLPIRVTPAVLIPRPETELLVEQALALLRGAEAPRLADVGCGSGCVALALATEIPGAEIYATDVSPSALAVARENAARLELEGRIRFCRADLLESVPGALDAVVSNPPYVDEKDWTLLPPEVREHEPREALWGGPRGLAVIRRLIPEAHERLAPGGFIALEIGSGMETAVMELLSREGFSEPSAALDLQGLPRVVRARKT